MWYNRNVTNTITYIRKVILIYFQVIPERIEICCIYERINMFEYLVKKKSEGSFRARRILIILGYVLLSFAFLMIMFLYILPTKDAPLIVIVALLEISAVTLLITFTKHFLNIEYEYEIVQDNISFYTISGKRFRKLGLELTLSDFYEIGQYDDIASVRLEDSGLSASYVYISSIDSDKVCYGLFRENDENCIVYFEAPDEAIAIIRRFNPSALRRAKIENDKYIQNH